MRNTKLLVVWNNPKPPQRCSPKVKRIETGKFTSVYSVTKPFFTSRLAVVSKRAAASPLVNSASA
jgi:hypothetical protein